MSNGEMIHQQQGGAIQVFTPDKVDLLKRTICRGATDDELELFLHACKRTGLDPFMRQIYAVKRKEWDPDAGCKVEKMVIQTGIDGYRLIADRTDRYMPGREPTFTYNDNGNLLSATAYVKKRDKSGEWHEIAASALFDEYAGKKSGGEPTMMWASKPHIMLAKCAEALVLRKAFPAELSGVYTKDEMDQADNPPAAARPVVSRPVESRRQLAPSKEAESRADGDHYDDEEPDLADDKTFMPMLGDAFRARGFTEPQGEAAIKDMLARGYKVESLADLDAGQRAGMLQYIAAGKADKYMKIQRGIQEPTETPPTDALPRNCQYEQICEIALEHKPKDLDAGDAVRGFESWMKTAISKKWDKVSRDEQERVFRGIKAGEPWAMAPVESNV
jgi:phage recombination protein Bet